MMLRDGDAAAPGDDTNSLAGLAMWSVTWRDVETFGASTDDAMASGTIPMIVPAASALDARTNGGSTAVSLMAVACFGAAMMTI